MRSRVDRFRCDVERCGWNAGECQRRTVCRRGIGQRPTVLDGLEWICGDAVERCRIQQFQLVALLGSG
jgi:hypothetical protein